MRLVDALLHFELYLKLYLFCLKLDTPLYLTLAASSPLEFHLFALPEGHREPTELGLNGRLIFQIRLVIVMNKEGAWDASQSCIGKTNPNQVEITMIGLLSRWSRLTRKERTWKLFWELQSVNSGGGRLEGESQGF